MANELILVEPSIEVNPTPITIKNLAQVEKAVAEYVDKYNQDFVVTSDNATDVRRMRASLHKVSEAFNERRLAAQRLYKVPLEEFNSTMKRLKQQVDSVIAPLDVKLNEVKEQERVAKLNYVNETISEMAPSYGVSASEVPIRDSWLNKTTSNKKITEEVAADMTQLKKDQDQRATDIQTIRMYADSIEVESSGWVALLSQGATVTDILSQMTHAAEKRDQEAKEAAEREAKRKETAQAIAATHQVEHEGETVDTDTGEVVLQTVILKLTGTNAQLKDLRGCVDRLGVKYEVIHE
ncbi:DUF1351 domain-containing protein [Levilactobacillus wangkuiensis]|uniref:DUF1351 domain-containing protein n=1 Tax=Levilactobacillus wangkuiensis TaxID=2799566 RepID=UPI0019430769|nr:DUF1351 domain-containing protein [Levilactobacillus wangkuiensis]